MIAYKFRSVANVEHTLDIIINNRLWCSDWQELNDPLEGKYFYQAPSGMSEIEKSEWETELKEAMTKYKICSLSRSFQSHLMWAHYADEFKGVAVEIELPDEHSDIAPMQPRGVFAFVGSDQFGDLDTIAKNILFSKYHAWNYENEVRILSQKSYFSEGIKVRRVIAGPRMNRALQGCLEFDLHEARSPVHNSWDW